MSYQKNENLSVLESSLKTQCALCSFPLHLSLEHHVPRISSAAMHVMNFDAFAGATMTHNASALSQICKVTQIQSNNNSKFRTSCSCSASLPASEHLSIFILISFRIHSSLLFQFARNFDCNQKIKKCKNSKNNSNYSSPMLGSSSPTQCAFRFPPSRLWLKRHVPRILSGTVHAMAFVLCACCCHDRSKRVNIVFSKRALISI